MTQLFRYQNILYTLVSDDLIQCLILARLFIMTTIIESIQREITWRKDLFSELGGQIVNRGIEPNFLRNWGIYGGQQGIWVDKQRTAPLTENGYGLAMGLLHKGDMYPDDFDETGVIYHYP